MAEERLFVVVLDQMDPTIDWSAVKALIKKDAAFSGWWNHLPGTFLVVSECDANAITDRIRSVTGGSRLLVIEANPAESEGWLPETSWDWIRRRTKMAQSSDTQTSAAPSKQTA